MDPHEPETPDATLAPGWSKGWTFELGSDDAPRIVPVDAADVDAARAAARAMQEALLEASRQSSLVDAAVASLVEQGARPEQIAGDVGLSLHVARDLVGGMSLLESVCRDAVAHAEGRPRGQQLD